jgi:hypothetical protein
MEGMTDDSLPPDSSRLLKGLAAKPGPEPQLKYQSYLLRLWRDSPEAAWHASLEDVITGQKYAFARLENLFGFLEGKGETSDAQ